MEAPKLSKLLKDRTLKEHEETENSPLMREIMGDTFTETAYALLLKRLYAFYAPLESETERFLAKHPIGYHYQAKLPLLCSDLLYFYPADTPLPVQKSLVPAIDTLESFLGVLYVIEGATLGGNIIRRRLEKHLDVDNAATFFCPYGKETGQRWRETQAFIDAADVQKLRVCNAAIATFRAFKGALRV